MKSLNHLHLHRKANRPSPPEGKSSTYPHTAKISSVMRKVNEIPLRLSREPACT